MKRSSASLETVKSPISRPFGLSIGASVIRPGSGRRPASMRFSQASAPAPGDLVLAVVRDLEQADARAHRPALLADRRMGVRAPEGRDLMRLAAAGANQSACSRPKLAPNTAPLALSRS